MSASPLLIREASEGDIESIRAIYSHYVETGLASFEEVAPEIAEIARRRAVARDAGLPYLVAERTGSVLGFAYASSYRPRPAYRFTVENSVYVRDDLRGGGIGGALLSALIERLAATPARQIIAVIGDSANGASIGLHRRLGFRMIGTLKSAGFKHGRWVDTVLMQRPVGAGDETMPVL